MQIGIDAGGSLTKIVERGEDGSPKTTTLDFSDIASIAGYRDGISPAVEIYATGCGAATLVNNFPGGIHVVDELESFCRGARYFTANRSDLPPPYILTSFGTGTSIFVIDELTSQRVSGTAVGGGTIIGLGRLLLEEDKFTSIMALADNGNRQKVDLMVSDLYPDTELSPVLSSLTAANFGGKQLHQAIRQDMASALVQMAVETIALLSMQVARTYTASSIIIAGSPSRHPLIRKRFEEIGNVFGVRFIFFDEGPYFGALGAILVGKK